MSKFREADMRNALLRLDYRNGHYYLPAGIDGRLRQKLFLRMWITGTDRLTSIGMQYRKQELEKETERSRATRERDHVGDEY